MRLSRSNLFSPDIFFLQSFASAGHKIAQITVRHHHDNRKFMRNPSLTNGNAQERQLSAWFWLIWRRMVAHPGASVSDFMRYRDDLEPAAAVQVQRTRLAVHA
jgi:hypothetical protein